jgi:hypothetical protein
VILSTPSILSIFIRVKPIIFVRLIIYLRFSNRNPLKQNKKYFGIRKRKPRYFNKRPRLKLFVSAKNKIYLIRKNKE